jgi:hypothetical protein
MKKLDTIFLIPVVVLALSSLWSLEARGQAKESYDAKEWHHGKVVLATGDSLFGAVVYHPNKDVVQVELEDGAISSFSPVNVSHFVVNDVHSGRPQLFRSLFWNLGKQNTDFKKPVFFEQLNHGTISIIRRQTGVRSSDKEFAVDPDNPLGQELAEDVKEDYYALLPDGEIVTLKKMQRDLQRLFGNKSDTVKQFVRSNKLDYNKPNEMLTIVNYFNSL